MFPYYVRNGKYHSRFLWGINIQNKAPKRTQHCHLTGSKNKRIDNVKKMSYVFCSHDINFEKSDVLFNVLTKKVLPEFLEIERERRKLHEQFLEKRIVGSKSIWDTINKGKPPTFANNKEVVIVKIRNQLLNIKAKRKLCQDLQSKIETWCRPTWLYWKVWIFSSSKINLHRGR